MKVIEVESCQARLPAASLGFTKILDPKPYTTWNILKGHLREPQKEQELHLKSVPKRCWCIEINCLGPRTGDSRFETTSPATVTSPSLFWINCILDIAVGFCLHWISTWISLLLLKLAPWNSIVACLEPTHHIIGACIAVRQEPNTQDTRLSLVSAIEHPGQPAAWSVPKGINIAYYWHANRSTYTHTHTYGCESKIGYGSLRGDPYYGSRVLT